MYDFISSFIASTSYLSIFVLMLFLPTESVMPFVGYAAAQGQVTFAAAVLVAAVGSTVGSLVVYWIARLVQPDAVYHFVTQYGPWIGISRRNLERAGKWFNRRDKVTVFVAKFIPGVRTAVSITAGFQRMSVYSFTLYTLLGNIIWSSAIAFLGYTARSGVQDLAELITNISSVVACALVLFLFLYLVRRRHRRRGNLS